MSQMQPGSIGNRHSVQWKNNRVAEGMTVFALNRLIHALAPSFTACTRCHNMHLTGCAHHAVAAERRCEELPNFHLSIQDVLAPLLIVSNNAHQRVDAPLARGSEHGFGRSRRSRCWASCCSRLRARCSAGSSNSSRCRGSSSSAGFAVTSSCLDLDLALPGTCRSSTSTAACLALATHTSVLT